MVKRKAAVSELKGWRQIAEYLGQPIPTAQHWAKSGMPTTRKGRNVVASPDELNHWLGTESGTPEAVHIANDTMDLAAELRRGLLKTRRTKRRRAA